MSASLLTNSGSRERLKVRTLCGCRPCASQIRCTVRKDSPLAAAMARPVQWVASPAGSPQVMATTCRTVASAVRGLPGLRVLSHSRLSTPASVAKRCCQRHTAGRLVPARRATSATASRSAECRMMRARAACFCGRLRSARTAANRWRSSAETMGQTVCAMIRQ